MDNAIVIALISAAIPATLAIIGAIIKHRAERKSDALARKLAAPDLAIERVIKSAEFADAQFEKLRAQFEVLETKYQTLDEQRASLQDQYDELDVKYDVLKEDHQRLIVEMADLRTKVAELSRENKRLKRELDAKR